MNIPKHWDVTVDLSEILEGQIHYPFWARVEEGPPFDDESDKKFFSVQMLPAGDYGSTTIVSVGSPPWIYHLDFQEFTSTRILDTTELQDELEELIRSVDFATMAWPPFFIGSWRNRSKRSVVGTAVAD